MFEIIAPVAEATWDKIDLNMSDYKDLHDYFTVWKFKEIVVQK